MIKIVFFYLILILLFSANIGYSKNTNDSLSWYIYTIECLEKNSSGNCLVSNNKEDSDMLCEGIILSFFESKDDTDENIYTFVNNMKLITKPKASINFIFNQQDKKLKFLTGAGIFKCKDLFYF